MATICIFFKKELVAQVPSREFYAIFKNNFFTDHLRATTFEL